MRIGEVLTSATIARIDAEVLLGHILGKDRAWLLAHAHDDVLPNAESAFDLFAARRTAGEPLAYIVGEREFYGRRFIVRPGVLIPRPCTEELVTTTLALLDGKSVEPVREIDKGIVVATTILGSLENVRTIVDIGTGSGCIAITLACERPQLALIATDISETALDIARENARTLGVADRLSFRHGNFLEPIADLREPFLLVSNPPYVANEKLLADDVRTHEPMTALMGGGDDGGVLLRELVLQAKQHPFCRGIVLECLSSQAPRPT